MNATRGVELLDLAEVVRRVHDRGAVVGEARGPARGSRRACARRRRWSARRAARAAAGARARSRCGADGARHPRGSTPAGRAARSSPSAPPTASMRSRGSRPRRPASAGEVAEVVAHREREVHAGLLRRVPDVAADARRGSSRDVDAGDPHRAGVGPAQAGDDRDQRRLPRAVRPEQRRAPRPRSTVEIDPVERRPSPPYALRTPLDRRGRRRLDRVLSGR